MSAERTPVSPQMLEHLEDGRRRLFNPGQILATPGALNLLKKHGVRPLTPLSFHLHGYWGEVDAEDSATNDAAVFNGNRILSVFSYGCEGEGLWVITDAASDDAGLNRQSTCLLLPGEY